MHLAPAIQESEFLILMILNLNMDKRLYLLMYLELLNIRKITISMLFIVMIIVNYIMVLYL